MICTKCNEDLTNCYCPDLPGRIVAISSVVAFGQDYFEEILKQVERVQGMNELQSVGVERPHCAAGCGKSALDGHMTCGEAGCNEVTQRLRTQHN